MSRSRLWLVSALSALVSFGLLFTIIGAFSTRHPELRIIQTGQNFSALVVTDDARLLIVNSDDRGETRSAIGLLARPWEPDPQTLLAPADDRAAIGLWEALRHPGIKQIIIVGLPGSDPIWSRIEAESRVRDISITYVSADSRVDIQTLELTIVLTDTDSNVIFREDQTVLRLNLTGSIGQDASHVAVGARLTSQEAAAADLVISLAKDAPEPGSRSVFVRDREVVTVILEPETVRIQGGTLVEEPVAN